MEVNDGNGRRRRRAEEHICRARKRGAALILADDTVRRSHRQSQFSLIRQSQASNEMRLSVLSAVTGFAILVAVNALSPCRSDRLLAVGPQSCQWGWVACIVTDLEQYLKYFSSLWSA
jgi:hypothetical protein